jgi:hypothetical protein
MMNILNCQNFQNPPRDLANTFEIAMLHHWIVIILYTFYQSWKNECFITSANIYSSSNFLTCTFTWVLPSPWCQL